MGLKDDKRKILNKISTLTSYNESELLLKNINDSLSSVNNKKDPIEFLIAVLGSIVGSEAIKIVLGNLIGKFIDNSESIVKESLKSQFVPPNSNSALPNDFKNIGINIPLKYLDNSGKFKISRNSDVGNLIYSKTGAKANFDNDINKSILNFDNNIESGNLIFNYNKSLGYVRVKPKNVSQNIYQFIEKTIDDYQILNKNEIITKSLDKIFGTVTKQTNRTKNEIIEDLKFDMMLNKLINNEDNIELTSSENYSISVDADNLKNGTMFNDIGCGIEFNEISIEDITDLIDDIIDTTDPQTIANKFDNLIDNSSTNVNDQTKEKNIKTVKDSFFKKLIDYIKENLIKSLVMSPFVKLLIALYKKFTNTTIDFVDNIKLLINNRSLIDCLIKKLLSELIKFIYDLVIVRVLKLVRPIIKSILNEKINSYRDIIKSLIKIKIPLIS